MEGIINLKLMAHPVNWLIVWIFLMMGFLAWHLVHDAVTRGPAIANGPGDDMGSTNPLDLT